MAPAPGNAGIARNGSLMAGWRKDAASGRPRGLLGRFLGRRSNYLVDRSYQVRTAIVAVIGMVVLLGFAAAVLHMVGLEHARIIAQRPIDVGPIAGGETRYLLYLVGAGIVCVAGVFLIEILETHKTAGVVFRVTRGLRALESGHWTSRITLRRYDNFKEMEESFNATARSLRDRVEDDLETLGGVQAQIRLASHEFESGNREGALHLLRHVDGALQTLCDRKRNMLQPTEADQSNPKI